MKSEKSRCLSFYVMPYLVLLVIHILMGLTMYGPTILPDEFGYLGRARYLSGVAEIIQGGAFYHFGYSLFLLPSFWLFSDPGHVYKAIMVTNSLLMSSLYFGLFYILRRFLECPKRISCLVAFSCCLYPAFILQSNIAWSENAFIPMYGIFIASIGTLVKKQSWLSVFLFGFSSAFLYTIHPRGLLIIPISIIFLLFLMLTKTLSKLKAFISGITVILIFITTNHLNDFLSLLDKGITVNNYVKGEILDLFRPSFWFPFILAATGQVLYLIDATYGLFLIGFVYVIRGISNKWSTCRVNAFNDPKFNIFIMLFFTSAGILVSSSVVILRVNAGDDLIYGRYNEGFLALYLVLSLVAIYKGHLIHKLSGANPYRISIIILALSCFLLLGYDYKSLIQWSSIYNVIVINIFGIYPFVGIFRRLDLLMVSLIIILLMFMLFYAFRIKFEFGLSVIIVYFFAVSLCGYTALFVRSEYIKGITTLRYDIASLGNIKTLSYDKSYLDKETWFSYQYFLPELNFNTFYSKKGEKPISRVVISGNAWNGGGTLSAELLAIENKSSGVPPIMQKIVEMFYDKPLEPNKKVDQALWLVRNDG